tara:strand:+ start:30851 stop:31105 length:255 start_codon:yes stop_codon:yes gene_type:complete
MDNHKVKLSDVFFEEKGKPSLKRIFGFVMLANGVVGKNALCIYAAMLTTEMANFNDIDNSLDGFIYGGVALSFGAIADKFFRRK